ncbi:hypothetical protein N658DRAFT_505614 [Parathielavia hyrcaniae]|uniref:D-xylose 1-dehydrogenase (NADP(+), D-xylono-1,5-lactone-forming) n=1 Tax=Parathielavia hyrcaniae TaxID=113614 RepID=A0AAN6Q446_9PEZI|nr:hypothetical protein N658DRAFT_505614 [Parathielavia hyrcaniae]
MSFTRRSKAEDKIVTPLKRFWRSKIIQPKVPDKALVPTRFGVLIRRDLDPTALIFPAKHHPGTIVWGVAAEDRHWAERALETHGLGHAYDSYDQLLLDATLDAVYIEVDIQHRLEWAIKALNKGKHVLLDTPAVGTPHDAVRLFNSPMLRPENAPVLLEAAPYRFHPSWLEFERHIDRPNIDTAMVRVTLPASRNTEKDIRFRREQSGGAQLDLTYAMFMLRCIFGTKPTACDEMKMEDGVAARAGYDGDYSYTGKWRFTTPSTTGQSVATAEARSTVESRLRSAMPFRARGVVIDVVHRKREVHNPKNTDGNKVEVIKAVTLRYHVGDASPHDIEIVDHITVTDPVSNRLIRMEARKTKTSAYTLGAGTTTEGLAAKPYWTAPMYQLDAFLQRIRSSPSHSHAWVSGNESINQMYMLGDAYLKMKRPLPSHSTFYFPYQMQGPSQTNGQPQAPNQGANPAQAPSNPSTPVLSEIQGSSQTEVLSQPHASSQEGSSAKGSYQMIASTSQAQGSSQAEGQSLSHASSQERSSAAGGSRVQEQSLSHASSQERSSAAEGSQVRGRSQPQNNLPSRAPSPPLRNPRRQSQAQLQTDTANQDEAGPGESSSQAQGQAQPQTSLLSPGAFPADANSDEESADKDSGLSVTETLTVEQIQAQPMV